MKIVGTSAENNMFWNQPRKSRCVFFLHSLLFSKWCCFSSKSVMWFKFMMMKWYMDWTGVPCNKVFYIPFSHNILRLHSYNIFKQTSRSPQFPIYHIWLCRTYFAFLRWETRHPCLKNYSLLLISLPSLSYNSNLLIYANFLKAVKWLKYSTLMFECNTHFRFVGKSYSLCVSQITYAYILTM